MGPKTEKDFLPKVSREKRGTVSNEASRERSVLEGQYQDACLGPWYSAYTGSPPLYCLVTLATPPESGVI